VYCTWHSARDFEGAVHVGLVDAEGEEGVEEGVGHEHHQQHRHLDEEGVRHPHQPAAHEHVLPPTATPNQRIEPFDEHLGGTKTDVDRTKT